MVWAACGYYGKSNIALITCKGDATVHKQTLSDHLLPFVHRMQLISGGNWKFQEDNAPPHRPESIRQWLAEHNIDKIEWPACSPDLNPIENLWGILSRRVFADGRQYSGVAALKSAIRECWDQITVDELRPLVNSMPKRIFEVVSKHGGSTSY